MKNRAKKGGSQHTTRWQKNWLALAISTALATLPVFTLADDTDIYITQQSDTATTIADPKVMLVLDYRSNLVVPSVSSMPLVGVRLMVSCQRTLLPIICSMQMVILSLIIQR